MKKLTLLLALSMSLFLFSCTKSTTNLTQAQLTALRLEKDLGISPNKPYTFATILVFNQSSNSVISSGGTSLTVTSDGFIVISGTNFTTKTFNLEQLKSYQIDAAQNLAFYY